MTEENKVSKEDTEEPLYFELKDNISSFYISDSDILKCILIADANHKIPTLDNNWIKQAEIYMLLLFKSGINLLTRFGKTNPINFDKI